MKNSLSKAMRMLSVLALIAGMGAGCSSGETGAAGHDGAEGTPGAAGPAGDPGTPGTSATVLEVSGTVDDGTGAVGAGIPVVVYQLTQDGLRIQRLGAGVTDASGSYHFMIAELTQVTTGLEVEATVPHGAPLRALVSQDHQDVSPVEDGVDRIVHDIVASEGGRALSDFSLDELDELVTASRTALQTAGTTLTDPEAIYANLIVQVGADFAQAAGGAAGFADAPVFTDPPDVLVPVVEDWVDLTDGKGQQQTVIWTGALSNASADDGENLIINGQNQPSDPGLSLEDGHEVVWGPNADTLGTGLTLTRKIYVSPNSTFVRYAEILANPTALDVTVDLELRSSFDWGSLQGTSSGDLVVDGTDSWLVAGYVGHPTAAILAPGAQLNQPWSQYYTAAFTGVLVPASSTVILLHWEFLEETGGAGEVVKRLNSHGHHLPLELYAGLSNAEIAASINANTFPNVAGDAGSVPPLATVTVTNLATSAEDVVQASAEGSFRAYVPYASGEQIQITGTQGTATTTLTAP